MQGDTRPQSETVVNGEKLALEEAGGKVGKFTIKYVSLDDATAAAGKWEPGQVSTNARKAAQDKSTIAYLGEFNSGASAISIPIINEAGILQISPSNTYVGLTRAEGADKGEPDKYYPTGKRTYGRVVPADDIQAAAQVTYQKDEGCTKIYILNDKEVYGKGVADRVDEHRARRRASDRRQRGHRHQGRQLPHAWRRRSRRPAPTASSSAASRRTRACRCGRTSTPPTRRQAVRPGRRRRVAVHARISQSRGEDLRHQPDARSEALPAGGQKFFDTYEEKYGHRRSPTRSTATRR